MSAQQNQLKDLMEEDFGAFVRSYSDTPVRPPRRCRCRGWGAAR